MNQLTTPEIRNYDPVFPGENWFFYWKSSPSLWEEKLRQYSGAQPLFVPINWSLHSEFSEHFDFGQHKPETDLRKLADCAKSAGKEIIFLVSLSPMPFISNGGVPSYLARNLSLNKDGIAMGVLDNAQNVNRIYSFYEPEVFQCYRKFVWHLGQFFTQTGISYPIFGLDCFRIEDEHIVSFFKDHSKIFESGFNRYIKQIQDTEPEKIEKLIAEPEYESCLKLEYCDLIRALYSDVAKEFLAGNWAGVINTCVLGASTADLFGRSSYKWESESDYFGPLMKALVNEYYPATMLLDEKMKRGPLGKAFKDIIDISLVRGQVDDDYYSNESSLSFSPLVFFQLIDTGVGHFSFEKMMDDAGLKYYFEREYPWAYKIRKNFDIPTEDYDERSVYFFVGARLDKKSFNKVLQLFMNGYHVFLDICGLPIELTRKLEIFFTENDLKTDKINYISPVVKASLGEGLLITYSSQKLLEASLVKRASFWDSMIGFLNVQHLPVQAENGVSYFWKTRSSNTYELNYQEVRRISFYNPTSYKKKVHIVSSQNFAYIRSIDQVNVEVKSTPIGIDLIMLPGSSVTLDYGFFE